MIEETPTPLTVPAPADDRYTLTRDKRKRGITTQLKGLARRLTTNQLTIEDKGALTQVRQIKALKREGATLIQIARETGMTEPAVRQYLKRGVYRLYADHLDQLEQGDDEKQIEKTVRTAKQKFASFAPDAIDYYRECFLRNPVDHQSLDGVFKDSARAMWATEKVSKGLGLTEPEHIVRPVVHIDLRLIHAEMAMVATDDATAAEAARTIDVTPTPA